MSPSANPVSSHGLDPETEERVDYLVSALIDDVISDHEVRELGQMLSDSLGARRRYLDNMQIHADLIDHYAEQRGEPRRATSPVLGSLGPEGSDIALPTVNPADQ